MTGSTIICDICGGADLPGIGYTVIDETGVHEVHVCIACLLARAEEMEVKLNEQS